MTRVLFALLVVIMGIMLVVTTSANAAKRPEASCYGPGLWGNPTADGTTLVASTVGVAHKTLPFGTRLYIRQGRRTILVKVIDRGPYVRGRNLDLTQATVKLLGFSSCSTWGHRPTQSWKAP